MSLLGTIGEELHDEIWKIREYVAHLLISDTQKRELYDAVREHNIVVSPMKLSTKQIAMLNNLSRNARAIYNRALDCAHTLPATNDCDEYAVQEAKDLWEEIKSH